MKRYNLFAMMNALKLVDQCIKWWCVY